MLLNLPKPFLVLAPMDDVTDTVFRQIVAECAPPDLFFTEFVNVDGLMSPGRSKLLRKLRFVPSETRLVAQLWGLKPENFRAIAEQIADGSLARELGLPEGCNFVGVDLNMVCPAKSGVQNGANSALITLEPRAFAAPILERSPDLHLTGYASARAGRQAAGTGTAKVRRPRTAKSTNWPPAARRRPEAAPARAARDR